MNTRKSVVLVLYFCLVTLLSQTAIGAPVLKIGVLPDVDSVPFIVAEAEGLFDAKGIDVELIRFSNAIERDSALQARTIDGEVADILAAAFALNSGLQVKITSITNGRYVILAAGNSGITTPDALRNVPIGLSTNTIIEYVTDRMLKSHGLKESEIAKMAIPKMPVRLQMLDVGAVKAACLPEPLATMAAASGARPILDTASMNLAPGVMVFRQEAVDEKSGTIEAMYEAYKDAARLLNENPDRYRDLLVAKAGFPEPVKDSFVFPHYTDPMLPTEAEVAEVIEWLYGRGLISTKIGYSQLVTDCFVD